MKKWIVAIAFCFACAAFGETVQLTELTSAHTPKNIDVTMTFSALPTYRAFMISNPDRLVVDFSSIKMTHHLGLVLPKNNVISDIRYATHRDGTLRMVFELNHFSDPRIRVLRHSKTGMVRLAFDFADDKPVTLLPPATTEEAPIVPQKKVAVNHVQVVKSKNTEPAPAVAEKAVLSDEKMETTSNNHRDIIVVIDPGHGGKDPGAKGVHGTNEKNVVLSISKTLEQTINQMSGFHAVLTRSTDRYLTLRERLRVARLDHADMFVAIHADKWRNVDARGVSVFALSQRGATSEAARWLAKRENASELMGGVQLTDQSQLLQSVLINLSQSATIRASLIVGKNIMDEVKPFARLHHQKVEQAAFVVLKSPDIPSLLVETGFLSNPMEEKNLCDPQYQNKLAVAIADGVRGYFASNPPRGTWLSYWKKHPNHRRETL